MKEYCISKTFPWQGKVTDKVAAVMRMFGLRVDRLNGAGITHSCQVKIEAGNIVYITGPSGAGKSVLLKELEKSIPADDRINLAEIELADDRAVIDCIEGDLLTSLKMLSTVGLNDCFCVLNSPATLSDGQKYRFRLAKALAMEKEFIFADEFCSNLDRVTATVVSYNIQKYAKRMGVTFVLAASQDDILADLAADVLIIKELAGPAEVIYKNCESKEEKPLDAKLQYN